MIATSLFAFSSLALASGASGGGYGGSGSFNNAPVRQVDESYEYGKSIYQGRLRGFQKYSYCVSLDGEKVPLKRKSIKQFKRASFNDVSAALYDCERPDVRIADEIDIQDFQFVLYYLNKRFRLALK